MEFLNPNWLSIEMASADAAIEEWSTGLRASFDAVSQSLSERPDLSGATREDEHHRDIVRQV